MKKYILFLFLVLASMIHSFGNGLDGIKADSAGADKLSAHTVSPLTEQSGKAILHADASLIRQFETLQNDMLFGRSETTQAFDEPKPLTLEQQYHATRAEALMQKVKLENRFVKYLDATSLIDLPIGLVSEGTSNDYAILIDSLVITPEYAYLTVYMCIPIPQSDKKLVFRGDNIRLSKNAGITGDARIFLVNDSAFELFGKETQMIIRGGAANTSAIWDCNGFKQANIVADINFSRNWLVPVEGNGNVTGHFETTISNWSNLVVGVNFQPFSLPSLKGVEFHTTNIVFDFSDLYTPENIQFPANYTSPQFIGNDKKLWRGFYMEDLKVLLPAEFKKKGETNRITFNGQHLLIDNSGFSGSVGVSNLFLLEQGDMNGWDYSLDSLGLSFLSNNLIGAGFKGNIVLPVGDKDKPFKYKAIINPGTSYVFNVQSLDVLNFDIWKAKVVLEKGSYLDVQVSNGKFKPKAVLSGSMDVKMQADGMSLLDIKFEELVIMTEAPYLDAKAFSFGSEKLEHTLKDFPVSISRIGFKKNGDDKAVISFNIGVHLTGQDDGAFKGDATFDIKASMSPVVKRWKYDGIAISEVGIDVDGGSFHLTGRIKIFEDDAIYGKGYNGTVEMTFEPGFVLNGTVIFGKVADYRYWYADAFVGLPTGIPFCGFLAFYGFGGGMYHNMEQVGFSTDEKMGPGKSLSGVIYKPNNEVRYGFKATVQIGLTSSKETFNGDVTVEMSFNKGGGLRRISLLGNGYVLLDQQLGDMKEMATQVESMSQHKDSYGKAEPGDIHATSGLRPPGKEAMISGHLFQYYDFENDVLHGEMEMYVDVYGVFKGIGPDGLAGWSVVHYSREEWFIYIGTPDRRVGLSVLGMMQMDGYFMVGTEIPGSPPPPAQVSRILGGVDLDYMRDANALGTGKGIAFGSSFTFDTGDQKALMFYGRFSMGVGFDVMLKKYGNDVRCKGSTKKLGINGWYANGQSYAYVEGKIGIKVKLFLKTKKVEILRIGAAVVLQAKLPNPVWMKGTVGGYFSVLGGLVKGHCKFELEIGDKCEVVDGSVLEGLSVIADLTPMHAGHDVDVFTTPQAVFNFQIDKEFEMVDVDDIRKTYRIKLDKFEVKDGAQICQANLKWNNDRTVALYDNLEVLPPKKELVAEVKVTFEEYKGGKWEKVKLNGQEVTEVMNATFTTGEAPDYIPQSNVAYSYPLLNQLNFYPNEYPQGYMKLKRGQAYLFNLPDVWVQKGRFIPTTGQPVLFDFNYSNALLTYNIPTKLANDQVYTLQFVSTPKEGSGGAVDRNVTTVSRDVKVDGVSTGTEVASRKAEGNIVTLQEQVLYKSFLRTSKFNTFNEKIDRMTISPGWTKPDDRGQAIHILGTNISAKEYFDEAELKGINENKALVSIVANLDDNKYYNNMVYPLVYEDYTSLTIPAARLESRDMSLGIPPIKAMYIRQYPASDGLVSDQDFATAAQSSTVQSANFNYELIYYMKSDYYDLQSQTARYYTYKGGVLTDRRRRILETVFPVIIQGNYQVDITYTLPGIDKVTTKRIYTIYNPFK